MPFQKNNTLGGRKAGSVGKVTIKVKEAFTTLLENNIDGLQEDIDSLDPKDRLKIILELASYITPKLRAVEVEANVHQENNEDLINRLLEIPEENFNKLYENN